mgnify:FL=1
MSESEKKTGSPVFGERPEGEEKMDILEFLKVVFFGIVEGITEWLPISSTGHMILVDEIFTWT